MAAKREIEFRVRVADHRHNYHALSGIVSVDDPTQTQPSAPKPRLTQTQFTVVQGACIAMIFGGVLMLIVAGLAANLALSTAAIAVMVAGLLGGTSSAAVVEADGRRCVPPPRATLRVPAAVGRAHDDYVGAVARLRAVNASEQVVAGVEAQVGYAGELLHEAARFHAAGASDSRQATVVRETLIDLAAHANALVAAAVEHHREVEVAALADPLLLDRAPDAGDFVALSHLIADESTAALAAIAASSRGPRLDG